MKHSTTAKTFTLAAVTALALGIAPMAKAQVDKGCSMATLTGTFAYTVTGVPLVGASSPVVGPYAEAGAQTFDGNGHTAAAGMLSANGNVMPANSTGTYLVNSDCTGTFALEIAPGITAHYFFVIAASGSEYQAICLDPVAVVTRIGRRLFPGRNI